MQNVLLIFISFVLGFGGVFSYRYFQTKQTDNVTASPTSALPTPQPPFALAPPAQAVSGTLTITKGQVDMLSRSSGEFQEATNGAQILIGESVATKENAAATATIADIATIHMGPSAELVFANLFATNMLLLQKTGKIEYQISKPTSVRALHALVSIDSDDVTINIIDTDMSITVTTGSAKFALVDNDNNTNVWEIKAGERANIDDEARTVKLVQAR